MNFTKRINKNPLITSIGIIASLIGVGTFIISLFGSVQNEVKMDREFSSALLLAIHELSSNLTHLKSIKNFTIYPNLMTPIIRLQYKDSLSFYTKYFDIVAIDVYGEENCLIPLIKLGQSISSKVSDEFSKDQLSSFDTKYSYTIDDLRFLNGFLLWYSSKIAEKYLESIFLTSFVHPRNMLEKSGDVYNIRFFLDDNQTVIEYSDYLGLID